MARLRLFQGQLNTAVPVLPPAPAHARPATQHPLSSGPIRLFLYACAVVALALLFAAFGRVVGLIGLSLALVGAGLGALDRTGRLRPVLRWTVRGLHTSRGRWLAAIVVMIALFAAFMLLRRPYSTLALAALLLIWLALLGVRAVHWAQAQPWAAILQRPVIRYALFAGVALALLGLLWITKPPYNQILLASLCLGGVPVVLTHRRASATRRDELVAVMQGAAIVAVLLALASTYVFQTALLFEFQDALRMLLVGAGAMAVAAQLSAQLQIGATIAQPTGQALSPATLTRGHKYLFGAGVVALLLLAEANGRILKIPMLVQMTAHAQFALLIVSIALMTIGLGGVRLAWRLPRIEWKTVLALLLIMAAALFLRFWQLGDSLRIFVDELNFSAVVRSFWGTPNVPLMEPMSSIAAFPYIYPYFQANTIELFGRNLMGLRAASAIIGALTVPAVYLLGRAAFDRTTALLAALLLATFPPHLHFSRLGLNNVADPLFGTLALAFLVRGLTRNRRFDYALGGAMLGLTHYFYEGGRFLFTPLVIAWLVGLIVLWRLRWRNFWPVVVMAVLAALPIYYTLYAENGPVAARMVNNGTALSGDYWQGLLRSSVNLQTHIEMRLIYPLLLYVRVGDGSMFYKGETALLLPALIPLFFLGCGYVLARLRRPGPLLLVIWVLATNLGNSLMVVADHSPRYVLVFPALMLLAAAGLRYTWGMLWPSDRLQRLGMILLAVLGLTLAIYQANYYFTDHLPTYNDQMRRGLPHRDPQDALLRSLNFPPHTQLHFISEIPPDPYYTRGVLGFYRDDLDMDSVRPREITREWIDNLERGIDHAFFVEPGHDEVLKLLRVYFYMLPPQWSPYEDLRPYYQFPLYYAPYLPQYSEDRLARLDRVRPRRDQMPTR